MTIAVGDKMPDVKLTKAGANGPEAVQASEYFKGRRVALFSVPGAFEIPAAVQCAVREMDFDPARRRFDGYVALGCVIRGETTHYDYVCGESARGLMDLSTRYSLAMGYGILTCENGDQAWARAGLNSGDKGGAAAKACLHMVALKNRLGLYPR